MSRQQQIIDAAGICDGDPEWEAFMKKVKEGKEQRDMSVQTRADEELDRAKEAIQTAITALSEIVINQCWGHDEFRASNMQAMNEALFQLLEMRRKLGE